MGGTFLQIIAGYRGECETCLDGVRHAWNDLTSSKAQKHRFQRRPPVIVYTVTSVEHPSYCAVDPFVYNISIAWLQPSYILYIILWAEKRSNRCYRNSKPSSLQQVTVPKPTSAHFCSKNVKKECVRGSIKDRQGYLTNNERSSTKGIQELEGRKKLLCVRKESLRRRKRREDSI